MQLIQSKAISVPNPWEPNLAGVFARSGGKVHFYCSGWRTFYGFAEDQSGPRVELAVPEGMKYLLPHSWRLIENADTSVLMFHENAGFDLERNVLLPEIPAFLSDAYKSRIKPEKYLVEAPFVFGDYCISHKGQTGYTCTKQGKRIWDFRGRAYLYTEIERWQDRVFFGTAGHGGYFYLLDLESGEPLAQIKTGGTACLERRGNLCWFLRFDGETEVLCVDLECGEIVDRAALPGRSSDDSKLRILGGRLHALTFQYRSRRLSHGIWNIVEL